MSALHARLTLFAAISAIEEDLRSAILNYLGQADRLSDILAPEMEAKCARRLCADTAEGVSGVATLDKLILYVDLADQYEILNRNSHALPPDIAAYVSSITPSLQRIVPVRNRVCHNRPLNFEDFPCVFDLATDFVSHSAVDRSFWSRLRHTLGRLGSEPHFVLSLTIPDLDRETSRHNLPSPDFDETGFLGRRRELVEIRRLCESSPYPVISLIGEGGIGKTALALRVAYDILDSECSPFDTIVWSSAKSSQITPHDIVRITAAIGDSLELLRHATRQLGDDTSQDPLPELLEYLELFRILLVLDNLETVLDQRIRDFLQRLPTGSKVLITSRVSIGAYDFPVKVMPLEVSDSMLLLRAVAKSRGANSLVRMPNKDLESYCSRLKNNPGFIKWFVSAVQAGIRPEDAFSRPDVFLQFCMDNIFVHLTDESRALLDVMTIAGVESGLSQAQLHFLSTLSPDGVQRGLQQLLTASIVTMATVPRAGSFDTRYRTTELAAEYLRRHHGPSQRAWADVTARKNQLRALEEELATSGCADPYAVTTVQPRDTGDLVVVKMLRTALKRARGHHDAEVDSLLDQARQLSPDYWEVRRVEAFINAERNNVEAARRCYEAAIELEPRSPALRLWFGGFLLRSNDTVLALEQFRHALREDPNSVAVRIEAARAELYLHNWAAADELIEPLLKAESLHERRARIAWDLYLQVAIRQAEWNYDRSEPVAAVRAYREFQVRWRECPQEAIDARTLDRIRKTLPHMGRLLADLQHLITCNEQAREMRQILSWAGLECQRCRAL